VPSILSGKSDNFAEFESTPKVGTVLALLLLPIGLIFLNTGLNMAASAGLVSLDDAWVQILRALGETPVALLITVLLGMVLLGWQKRKSAGLIEAVVDSALGPVSAVILITGADDRRPHHVGGTAPTRRDE
jgi:GntP family gluconate:H+ symporter